MPGQPADWLYVTLAAVREAMQHRLEEGGLDAEAEREMELALEMLALMWEEIVGQRESLDREHRRFEDFFEFSPDAYAITDAGGNVREANFALADLLCVPREAMIGRPLGGFIVETDRAAFISRFVGLTIHPAPQPLSWSCRVQRAGGAPREVIVSVRAIPLRRSGVAGLCWLLRPA